MKTIYKRTTKKVDPFTGDGPYVFELVSEEISVVFIGSLSERGSKDWICLWDSQHEPGSIFELGNIWEEDSLKRWIENHNATCVEFDGRIIIRED